MADSEENKDTENDAPEAPANGATAEQADVSTETAATSDEGNPEAVVDERAAAGDEADKGVVATDAQPSADDAGHDAAGAEPDTDAEPAAVAPPEDSESKPATKVKKSKAKQMTAGQRLAAAKAAKAARKAAAKTTDDEVIEDAAEERAIAATNWVQEHQKAILTGVGIVAVASALLLGGTYLSGSSARAASAALQDAMATAEAPVGEAPEDAPSNIERYEDEAARDTAFLTKAESVIAEHGDAAITAYARLAVARLKAQAGEADEARRLYEAALSADDASTVVRARALEGLAFLSEAAGEWTDAEERYTALAALGGAYEPTAEYHRARVELAQGNEDAAKERLQALLETLREEDAPRLPFVQDQAELTLMGIDASLVQRSAPAGGGLDGIPPELLQQLMEQQQRQQQQGAP